jgi:CBS domain-containing protein
VREQAVLISEILSIKGGEVISVPPDCRIVEAVAKMVERDISSLVIMNGDTMVGLLTGRDLLRGMHAKGCDLAQLKVSDVMVTEPIIGNPDDTVDYVRGVMTENRITHLPVMEGERLLGIISFYDVARACLSEAKLENRLLKRYIRHWPE